VRNAGSNPRRGLHRIVPASSRGYVREARRVTPSRHLPPARGRCCMRKSDGLTTRIPRHERSRSRCLSPETMTSTLPANAASSTRSSAGSAAISRTASDGDTTSPILATWRVACFAGSSAHPNFAVSTRPNSKSNGREVTSPMRLSSAARYTSSGAPPGKMNAEMRTFVSRTTLTQRDALRGSVVRRLAR
jgi:hypothetical protein